MEKFQNLVRWPLALIIGIVFIVVGEVLFKKLQRGFAEEF